MVGALSHGGGTRAWTSPTESSAFALESGNSGANAFATGTGSTLAYLANRVVAFAPERGKLRGERVCCGPIAWTVRNLNKKKWRKEPD